MEEFIKFCSSTKKDDNASLSSSVILQMDKFSISKYRVLSSIVANKYFCGFLHSGHSFSNHFFSSGVNLPSLIRRNSRRKFSTSVFVILGFGTACIITLSLFVYYYTTKVLLFLGIRKNEEDDLRYRWLKEVDRRVNAMENHKNANWSLRCVTYSWPTEFRHFMAQY